MTDTLARVSEVMPTATGWLEGKYLDIFPDLPKPYITFCSHFQATIGLLDVANWDICGCGVAGTLLLDQLELTCLARLHASDYGYLNT